MPVKHKADKRTQSKKKYGLRDRTASQMAMGRPQPKELESESESEEIEAENEVSEQNDDEHDTDKVQIFMNSNCKKNHVNFKFRALIPEREIRIADFEHHDLLDLLEFYKFEKLNKSCRGKVSKKLVREFYANLRPEIEHEGDDQQLVFLRGKMITLNAGVINQFYGFDPVEDFSITDIGNVCLPDAIAEITGQSVCETNPEFVSKHQLTTFYRMLHLYLCETLLPTGHGATIKHDRVKFLYYIGQKNKLDIGCFMFSKMMHLVVNPTSRTALPYGGFVCALASEHGVPFLKGDVYEKKKGPFGKRTLDRLLQKEQVPQSTEQASQQLRQPASQPSIQPPTTSGDSTSKAKFEELVLSNFDRVFRDLKMLSRNQIFLFNELKTIKEEGRQSRKRFLGTPPPSSDEDEETAEEAPATVAEKLGDKPESSKSKDIHDSDSGLL